MNNYLCYKGKDLANDIDPVPNPLLCDNYEVNDKKARFYFKAITIQNIRNAFAKIKTTMSFGTDCISSYFLNLELPFIENSLALLFNSSMEKSQCPDAWKIARIVSVFKDGDKEIKSNYRPISILPVISRVFEKLIADQLYQYMNENSLFSPDQSGLLKHHSTATCMLNNTDECYKGFDLGKLVGLVFIEIKKAFDTVDHQILLKKLMLYGVQQCELSWFKSYLTNCKQFCMINGTESDIGDIDIGIPQGSCLGPLLLILYINDLPQAIKQSTISMYADDTSLCYQVSNMTQLIEAINMDLKELDTWLQGNKLSLNVAKTHSMLLSTKQRKNTHKSRNETFHLKIRGNELQDATKAKYLGVVIHCSLDWREQIQSISSKVSRARGFLKYAYSILPMETVIALYRGIVEPHFRYCCSVCGCAGKTEVNQLQKLQNRAARIVTGSRFDAPSGPII